MIPTDLLSRPMTELLGAFGSGILPAGGPTAALRASSATLDAVHDTGRIAISSIEGDWLGLSAARAIVKAEEVQRSIIAISDRGNDIALVVTEASEIIRTGVLRLEEILQSFTSLAVAAGPTLATPTGQTMIIAAALDHLDEATAVVTRVQAELDDKTRKMNTLVPAEEVPTAPAATVSANAGSAFASTAAVSPECSNAVGRSVSGFASPPSAPPLTGLMRLVSNISSPPGVGAREDSLLGTPGGATRGPSMPDSGYNGEGVEVVLPDGSTVLAPNTEAAEAVRNALSQQGVPYVWGGTSPGEGLDCSGLTQWAYGEVGVDIPRLAQEQNIGMAVDPSSLMPGDLAVWDGHVAMVIGNGQLIEAGDPVQIGPVRTSNSGMGFYGFYRPSERTS
ncbi:NlpC/P60 family protein [Rhodococcus sp. NPDC049939]|uniref:NlpC/P60 family protein n=1 Tax=Rhodococcus sp. NPDC049939 TaxID=3155511 RepID=UPI0033DCFE08